MNAGHIVSGKFAAVMLALVGTSGLMIGAGLVATINGMGTRPVPPAPVITVTSDHDRGDTATVTRHEGATHIVTGDGRLIIVPSNPAECVRLALPSAEYADCVPEYVG
jgi:hypothetical protein